MFRLNVNQMIYFITIIAIKFVGKSSANHSYFCGGTLTMMNFFLPDLNVFNLLLYLC